MRRWGIIAGTAVTTFAAGSALVALVLALSFGPRAKIRIAQYQYASTIVTWNAPPMQDTQPGFMENRPVKTNMRFLGVHIMQAAGAQGSMRVIWMPYGWIIFGGVVVAAVSRSRMARRER